MPLVGLCGEPKEALEKIRIHDAGAFPAGAVFGRRASPDGKKTVRQSLYGSRKNTAEALEALDCLIWSGSCENALSEEVDSLLEEYPRLAVIFVADSPDAVFDALTKPFFHVVRGYALEQDLKAALAKLKKQRRTGSGYRSFPYRESPSSDGRIRVTGKGNPVSGKYAARDLGALRKEGVPDVGNARILGGKAARQVVFTRSTKVFWSIPGRSAGLEGK